MKWIAIAAIALLAGCSKPKEREVSGQAFVVLNNRDTVKLSLLDIVAVPEAEALQRLSRASECKTKTKELRIQKADLEKDIQLLEKEIAAKKELAKQFEGHANRFIAQTDSKNPPELAKEISRSFDSAMASWKLVEKRIEEAVEKQGAAQTKLTDVQAALRLWSGPRPYLEGPWKTVRAKVTTDADGKFSIKLPMEKLYLAGYATRKSLADEEEFGWIEPVISETVMLNNKNMLAVP